MSTSGTRLGRWAAFASALVMLLSGVALPAAPPGELIANGGFDLDADADGWADGWARQGGARIEREDGNAWLVLEGYVSPGQTIDLDPDWWKLRVSCRMKTSGVVLGDEGWKNARLAMNFVDGAGKHVDPWPNVFSAQGTTPWTRHEREFPIPPGAKRLVITPAMFGASGRAEYDDVSVTVSRVRSKMKENVPTPAGAPAPWDMDAAWRRKSSTRERVCLNDLWRFLPVVKGDDGGDAETPPAAGEGWGWFKVPGMWPYSMSGEEPQHMLVPGYVEERIDPAKLDQAWYRREVTVPPSWRGRRVFLDFTVVQTHARVFIDAKLAGEVWFPGGRLDVTGSVKFGRKQDLAVLLTARPLEKESRDFMAPDRVLKSEAWIQHRGLTGDVFMEAAPGGPTVSDVHVVTSVSKSTVTFDVGVEGDLPARFKLRAKVLEGGRVVRRFQSPSLPAGALKDGRVSFPSPWPDAKLWDVETHAGGSPKNLYDAVVELTDAGGKVLDETLPVRFGFREFGIEGRDFRLNGTPLHLRALLVRNMTSGADLACVERSRETCRRMRDYGFNFFITSNYHFRPGGVGYMDGLLDAADEEGVLSAFSLPHITDFNLDPARPASAAGYRRLAEWLVRRVQNRPSVILYAMNHNATGYYGDQNPLRIDGIFSPEDERVKGAYKSSNREKALMVAGVAADLDPTRPVYHHQSGNLGAMHTVNIYLNWAPMQERSDWLEHWGTDGAKPLFFVEWGLPHISSWSSFRGPAFIWRTEAFQSVWDSEYAADYLGQEAYRMTPTKVRSMAHEEDLWSRGEPFHWGWLIQHLRTQEENYHEIQALLCGDNWRSHRTWGISSMLPWDQEGLWRNAPEGGDKGRAYERRLEGLQAPGIVPDYLRADGQYIQAVDRFAVGATVLGESFLRWNMPLCAYVGGAGEGERPRFTEKGHNFLPGETVRKQLVVLNDTRREASCAWSCKVAPGGQARNGKVSVAPGGKEFVPVTFELPRDARPGARTLAARFDFGEGGVQTDALELNVMPSPEPVRLRSRVALFDPKGMTASMLDDLGVRYAKVSARDDLARFDLLVVGREAVGPATPCPDVSRVREGLRVLVFEQTYDALVNRLGFRANVHGMRRCFVRAPGHEALEGLSDLHLRDWRGAATLVPPHLDITEVEHSDPKWNWLGFTNTRVWRCGNNGNVASVLIEKPARGNFTPLVDCGFDLQYSPLLEYEEGKGRVVFCQLDVTGRTEADPAARAVCAGLLEHLDRDHSPRRRVVVYRGDERGADLLRRLGVEFGRDSARAAPGRTLLVLGPGAKPDGPARAANVLCLGLGPDEVARVAGDAVRAEAREVVPSLVQSFTRPELRGISNAELHWRTLVKFAALELPPEGSREARESNEALRVVERGRGRIVLCQAAPWMFDFAKKPYLRTTYRRTVFLVAQLLRNLGAAPESPLLARFGGEASLHDFTLPAAWKGKVDREEKGKELGWHEPRFDDSKWRPIDVPGAFDRQRTELADYDGVFWYRLRFRTPPGLAREGLRLHIGGVDDESWTWLNGKFLGEVTKATNPKDYWNFPRTYDMEPGMLAGGGENGLVVRCRDTYMTGGITGTPRLAAPGPWLDGYYVQGPEAIDDPYRYYRW